MWQQIIVMTGVGLVGLAYLLVFNYTVIIPHIKAPHHSAAQWLYQHRYQYLYAAFIPFAILWPGIEEAGARGIPLLLFHNRWQLTIALVILNIGFMAGHRDRDIIGAKRWLGRYITGLLICVPAIAFYSLYGCYVLHALWNLSVNWRRRHDYEPDRIIIWTFRPLEVLLTKSARPTESYRVWFPWLKTIS